MITKCQATVYHGGGRRWFTLRAACNARAKEMINKRCECEKSRCGEEFEPGYTCDYHNNEQRWRRLRDTLSRLYMAEFRKA